MGHEARVIVLIEKYEISLEKNIIVFTKCRKFSFAKVYITIHLKIIIEIKVNYAKPKQYFI